MLREKLKPNESDLFTTLPCTDLLLCVSRTLALTRSSAPSAPAPVPLVRWYLGAAHILSSHQPPKKMELNRQLKAMEERMAATSPMDEFHPMNRPTGSAKSAKSAKLNVIKGGKGRALKAVAAGAAAGVVTGGRGSASPANGYSPAPGRSSSNSSRTPSGMSVSQPRFRPELKNRTYTAEQQIKMRRDNVSLLSNLERIQRRGGGTWSPK